jgi:hypothetical protein
VGQYGTAGYIVNRVLRQLKLVVATFYESHGFVRGSLSDEIGWESKTTVDIELDVDI